MTLKVGNKGAKDLMGNWTVGGRTRHVQVKQYFIRDLKADGLITIEWVPSEDMTADILAKNVNGPLPNKHITKLVGKDEYMND